MSDLPDWEMKDVRSFVELVADEEAKRLLKETADGYAFPETDRPLFRDTITGIYGAAFIDGLKVMMEMYQANQLISLLQTTNISEVVYLVMEFKKRQEGGKGLH
jgi:glutaredoxin-related protein